MKLTSVSLYPAQADKHISLSFRDPTAKNPYQVIGITGLDAEEIAALYSGKATFSGDNYYSPTLNGREVVILVALNPEFTVGKDYSELRDDLYRLISSSRTGDIQIRFNNGNNVIAAVTGYVTKLETPHFTKQPQAQLTITCKDPMLKSLTRYSVPDVEALNPLNTAIHDDVSTAQHGFRFVVQFTGSHGAFSIRDYSGDWNFRVDLSRFGGFHTGDKLHFGSEYNNKELFLEKADHSITYLTDTVDSGSVWPIIFPGVNHFICSAGVEWKSITYYNSYWGV